ncbi:MAG: hypothetical protein ACKOCN_10830, partial [Planctomycetaceae bacterium]
GAARPDAVVAKGKPPTIDPPVCRITGLLLGGGRRSSRSGSLFMSMVLRLDLLQGSKSSLLGSDLSKIEVNGPRMDPSEAVHRRLESPLFLGSS